MLREDGPIGSVGEAERLRPREARMAPEVARMQLQIVENVLVRRPGLAHRLEAREEEGGRQRAPRDGEGGASATRSCEGAEHAVERVVLEGGGHAISCP